MPILTKDEHRAALKEVEQLFDSDPEIGSPQAKRMDQLITLIADYEDNAPEFKEFNERIANITLEEALRNIQIDQSIPPQK